MAKIDGITFTLKGQSGADYEFELYTLDTNFNAVGGIYAFVRLIENNAKCSRIYCGKTEDLSTRFQNHHKQDEIEGHKANAIGILRVNTEEERTKIEIDILENNDFPCNDQHN